MVTDWPCCCGAITFQFSGRAILSEPRLEVTSLGLGSTSFSTTALPDVLAPAEGAEDAAPVPDDLKTAPLFRLSDTHCPVFAP